jgi:colanic acid biosynthesis glycosyl transferase WcaI
MKKKGIKIAFFTHWYFPEKIGCSSRVYNYCTSFSKYYDVDIICPFPAFPFGTFNKQSKLIQRETVENVNIIRLYNYIPGKKDRIFKRYINFLFFPFIASFFLFLKRKKYDLVITTSPPIFISMIGYFASKILKTKWILDVRDTWIENAIQLNFLKENGLIHKLLLKFEREAFKTCDNLIFFTETVLTHYKNKYPELNLEKKSMIIYNGVNTLIFKPTLNWYEKKDQILYHGNIGMAQDLLIFVKSIAKLNKDVKFILYGTGDKMDEIQNYIQENSLNDIVKIEKPVDKEEIPNIINQFKIGIVSLKQNVGLDYTVPTKLLEFMACGVPIIASKLKEIDQILSKSKAGLTSNNNEEEIKEKLSMLLENDELAEGMGKNGRKFVINNFDWNENIKPLLKFIDTMEHI